MEAKRRNQWPAWLQKHPQNLGKQTRRVLVQRFHGRMHAALQSPKGNRSGAFWRKHVVKQELAGKAHRRNLHPVSGKSMHWRSKIKQEMTASLRGDLKEKRTLQNAIANARAQRKKPPPASPDKSSPSNNPAPKGPSPMNPSPASPAKVAIIQNRRTQQPLKASDPPKKTAPTNRRIQKAVKQPPTNTPAKDVTKAPVKQNNATPAKQQPQKNATKSPPPNRRIQKAVKQEPTKSPPPPAKTQQQPKPTPAKQAKSTKSEPAKNPQKGPPPNRRIQNAKKASPAKSPPQKTKQSVKPPSKGK